MSEGVTIHGRLMRRAVGRRPAPKQVEPLTTEPTPATTPALRAIATPRLPGPSRLARQLALAYLIEQKIERGEFRDYADAARRLGITRARITQVANLARLPVRVQEEILIGHTIATEHALRVSLSCSHNAFRCSALNVA